MPRWTPCLCLVALLLVAPGHTAPPPKTLLAKRMDFPELDDPKTTLREALEFLTKRSNLKFDVDEKQFKAAQVADVLAFPVGEPLLPAQKNVSVGAIAQQVLNRLPVTATYVVQGGKVRVVPVSPEVLKAIATETRTSVARPRLARSFTADPALRASPTLANLVRYLKDKHDLQLVVQTKSLGPDAAEQKLRLPRFGSVNLETLLKQVATQTGATALLRHDHVLLLKPVR